MDDLGTKNNSDHIALGRLKTHAEGPTAAPANQKIGSAACALRHDRYGSKPSQNLTSKLKHLLGAWHWISIQQTLNLVKDSILRKALWKKDGPSGSTRHQGTHLLNQVHGPFAQLYSHFWAPSFGSSTLLLSGTCSSGLALQIVKQNVNSFYLSTSFDVIFNKMPNSIGCTKSSALHRRCAWDPALPLPSG